MRYEAVLFDYDGTIVDSNPVIVASWQHMAKKFIGHEIPEDILRKTFGLLLMDGFKVIANEYGLPSDEKTLHEMDVTYSSYQKEHIVGGYPVFPGMIELIKDLHRAGVKLGIVTSRRMKSVHEGLEDYGIKDCFSFVVCAETTNIHKPNGYPAKLCCEKLLVDPKDAVMVGDSKYDIACGNNAGCSSIFVNWSFSNTKEDIEEYSKATYYVDSAKEIFDIVVL